ncbi:hypothetical protein [Bradyrhizobium sp. 21]|uniref:hypothetical protein n=1 Tax=Bradyrhizobium sp. 21 TaxID=2782666 RepID=UPI001FFA47E8|nr:hypothetical protein [Bradyrhizobium sp. 21]MCK1389023.1 hypothetical protein [Bradyrhizobium sp. 21]
MTVFAHREVLIPLVDGRSTGAICRVTANGSLPSTHPAHLDRAISELLECGLYQAGQQAQAAVRRIQLPGGWLNRPAPVALSVLNPGDVVGLTPDNSASAELGLALAKLMYVTQSGAERVIATGRLKPKVDEADALVEPVTHLGAKFGLVKQYFSQAGAPTPPRLFFAPLTDTDAEPVGVKFASEIDELARMGITVQPIADLRSAASGARASRLAKRSYTRWAEQAIALASLLSICAAAGYWSLSRPIQLEFLSAALANGRVAMTPAGLRRGSSDEETLLPSCRSVDGLPILRPGDTLVIRVGSVTENAWLQPFARHFHLLVALSDKTGVKVLPLPQDIEMGGVHSGDAIAFKLSVPDGPDEDNLVALVAQRSRPFDAAGLEKSLREVLDSLQSSQRISATRNLLAKIAPGYIEYAFRSTRESVCPE